MKVTQRMPIKLDGKDKKILEQLQENARLTISQISKITKLPRDVVAYRIKKLEQIKVIVKHHTVLDPKTMGYPLHVYVLFSCYNLKPADETNFVNYLMSHNRIVYVAKISGKYDFSIGVCAENYMEFDEVIRKIRQKFTDTIKDIEVLPTVEEYKYDLMTGLIETKDF